MDLSITPKANPTIDFWFEFGSNYSYLSVMRIEEEAARRQVAVRWQPFLLGPIFRSFGWESSPFVLQKQKGGLRLEGYGAPVQEVRHILGQADELSAVRHTAFARGPDRG